MNLPDGFVLKGGLIFWGNSFSKESYVARGYEMRVPNLSIASTGVLNDWHGRCRRMLSQVGEDLALQFQWSVDSDYRAELDTHNALTDGYSRSGDWLYNDWISFVRQERHDRARRDMLGGGLRREGCASI